MNSVVVLAEKPQQAEAIASAFTYRKTKTHIDIAPCDLLPHGAKVVWCIGFLVTLKEPEDYDPVYAEWNLDQLPILIDKVQTKVIKDKQSQFTIVSKALREADEIIIATDPALVGAEIGYSTIFKAGTASKPIRYLWAKSLTKNGIRKAFGSLRSKEETIKLYHASLARSISDWTIGLNLSRCYTLLLQEKMKAGSDLHTGVFSVGRIQTVLLKALYDREIAIENFKSKPFWEVFVDLKYGDKTIRGKWFTTDQDRLEDKQMAEKLASHCKAKPSKVLSVKKDRKEFKPPHLFNLSTLQATANNKWGMEAKKVLSTVQSLYERKYCSYPRTSSQHITQEEAYELPKIMSGLSQLEEYHHLFPTHLEPGQLSNRYIDENKVEDHYALIPTEKVPNLKELKDDERKIYDLIVKSVIAAHYENAVYDYTSIVSLVDNRFTFESKGKQVIKDGWHTVFENDNKETDDPDDVILPLLREGESGTVATTEMQEGKTKPPSRLKEGSLITYMKSNNLATEATRSGMIETLYARNYMEKIKGSQLGITAKGRMIIEAINKNSPLLDIKTTSVWEEYLEKVSRGDKSARPFIERAKELTKVLIDEAIAESKEWDFTEHENKMKEDEVIGYCPQCNEAVIEKQTKDGHSFYGCKGYATVNCNYRIPSKMLNKKISVANAKRLMEKGKTNLIKGFKSKRKGSTFDAFLVYDINKNQLSFDFPPKPTKKS
ncbi:type IA DNA topoisomerase [Desertibacillus haloalkaliphilus]|uniref:type IA DNA topoisomerase n=1 Tax=Desertibacillus haloalkaliphilus TaxID=1328930 RepID=UPI001C27BC7A|nr:type IA DNA topoisomerase [Desertibacillus haloalkaliphilus]MBU8908106.1 topoisomerase C-terminal repeat-containing protein [Desertibacillus haloalkaliphilus]